MPSYGTKQIRNVVLLSHSGAGKTSLSESLLFSCGAISRLGRVEEGTTASDFDPDEIKRKISINLSLIPCPWKDNKVNLIDTPGYADFVGEALAGLRVVEGAVIVVCAASSVQVGTEQVWKYSEEHKAPRLIFVNRMDRENADFYRVVEDIRSKFGQRCAPVQVPIGAQQDFKGVFDLLSGKAYGPGGQEIPSPATPPQAQALREKMVEAAAETDDALIAKYLEGTELTQDEVRKALVAGTRSGQIVPILVGSALKNVGVASLLDSVLQFVPSPEEAPPPAASKPSNHQEVKLQASASAPLATLVFKTTADPYVGKLTYLRVFSGTLASNSNVWNANKNSAERIGQLYVLRGKTQEAVPQLVAGDIGAVAKLSVTGTSDTLCTREQPVIIAPITFPAPVLSMAVHPKTKADLDKMGSSLKRLVEEDLTLHLHIEPDTSETILSGMGETHIEVAADRLHRKFGVEVNLEWPRVPYKETITQKVQAGYRHKKQTGGHGQFGEVFMEFEPLPPNSGIEFVDKIVGGAISKNFIAGTEKGIMEASAEGVIAGYPVTDVRGTLLDGKEHPVDSSDICFKIAGAGALKKGLTDGKPVLLEPVMKVKVTVPDNYTGDIIGDLNTKRAKVLGMTPQGGMNEIDALVPLGEVQRYAIDLRSITQGRGAFTMSFSHYDQVPAHVTQKIAAEKAAAAKKA
ncbi:MAG: elongation factor G [Chloroflexi bacterium]|nr:elongation factor G [Chloroflexota bacterium]